MRVLLTTDTIGGVWTFTKELTQHLLEQGHAVALVSFGREPSAEQHMWCVQTAARFSSAFYFRPSDVPLEWMQDNRRVYESGEAVLIEIARWFRPEILHSNQYCFSGVPLDVPKVITAHSDVLSWAVACRPGGLPTSRWLTQYCDLVQSGLDAADVVVAPTRWMLAALEQHFFVPRITRVIANGRTHPFSHRIHERKMQAITVGRLWDEAKGLAALLSIDSPVKIQVAGEENFEAASAKITSRHLEFAGHLTEEQILSLFRQSSLYLAVSIYEPFGLAPLEAALCGCAVVTRDLPSFREVWDDAAVYFSDSESLETALCELSTNKELLQSAQNRAMRRALQYSGRTMANAYLDLYAALTDHASIAEEAASHAA
jgi:glycogen synthase